mmetsp:Transcript_19334/g.41747  ORF Transcript_19334/g.41747 Transcript_19334/m.41747 type:complete len:327 (-) Transcript_19334:62-1042(-)
MLRLRPIALRSAEYATSFARGGAGGAARSTTIGITGRSSTASSSTFTARLSSSSSSTKKPFEPPTIKLDPSKNELHEKAARAAQLHDELNALLEDQAKRRADELTRPFGSGFVDFVKRSKGEMINIFAAFCCVLLAYQIASMRRGARKLLERAEEREGAIAELRAVLASVVGEAFVSDLADKCADAVANSDSTNTSPSSSSSSRGWFSRTSSSSDEELERIRRIIRPVIERELELFIGDRSLSDKEKEDKHLEELQSMMGVPTSTVELNVATVEAKPAQTKVSEKEEATLGGMEELVVEIQKSEGEHDTSEEGTKVLKRRKYAGSI